MLFENIDTLQLCVLARSLGGRRHVCCRVVSGRSRRGRLHVVCRCCSATSSSLRRRGAVGARDGHDSHRVGNTSTYVVSWIPRRGGMGQSLKGAWWEWRWFLSPNFLWTLTLSNPFFPVYTVSFSYSRLGLQGNWRPTGLPKTSGVLQGARCWLADSYSFSPVVVHRFPDTPPSYANSSRCFRSQFSARSLGRSGRYPLRTDRSLPLSWGWLPGSLVGLQFRELPGPWGPKGVELLVFSFVVVVRPLVGNTTRLVYPGWFEVPR